jgi:hypothetical protein
VVATGEALIAIAWTAGCFRVGGRRWVARATERAMSDPESDTGGPAVNVAALQRCARAVSRAKTVWPGRVTCLQTALVLHGMVRRRGVRSALRIGVRRAGERLESHAWVDAAGYVLDDADLYTLYTPFSLRGGLAHEGTI